MSKYKHKKLIVAIAGSLLFLSNYSFADNLLKIYQLAKENDPVFLASEVTNEAADETVNQSLATLLPDINLSSAYNYNTSESISPFVVTEAGPQQGQVIDTQSSSDSTSYGGISLNLSQQIYNHASWVNLAQSKKQVLKSHLSHEAVKQQLMIRVVQAYFDVLAARDNLQFSKSQVEALEKKLLQSKQRFDVGLIAMTDVHEAQASYDSAFATQITAQNTLDNAFEALQQITGMYHYDILGLSEDINYKKPQPDVIEDWVKAAETDNIDIKASKVDLNIAKSAISVAQAGHYPTVNLSASYNYSAKVETDTTRPLIGSDGVPTNSSITNTTISDAGDNESKSIGISVNVPIYSGGAVNSRVRQSQSEYLRAAHNLEAERRKAVSNARSSYLGVIASISSVKAFKQAVISAQSALEATQAGFDVGTRTIVDVLQQTQSLFNAKQQYSKSRYDYIINTLKLKQAVGALSEEDLLKVNQMLR